MIGLKSGAGASWAAYVVANGESPQASTVQMMSVPPTLVIEVPTA
jgi:hypothetical protein